MQYADVAWVGLCCSHARVAIKAEQFDDVNSAIGWLHNGGPSQKLTNHRDCVRVLAVIKRGELDRIISRNGPWHIGSRTQPGTWAAPPASDTIWAMNGCSYFHCVVAWADANFAEQKQRIISVSQPSKEELVKIRDWLNTLIDRA